MTQAAGRVISRERIIAVGDGLATDIAGANAQQVDAFYIAGPGGLHQGASDPQSLAVLLHDTGTHVVGASEALKW